MFISHKDNIIYIKQQLSSLESKESFIINFPLFQCILLNDPTKHTQSISNEKKVLPFEWHQQLPNNILLDSSTKKS